MSVLQQEEKKWEQLVLEGLKTVADYVRLNPTQRDNMSAVIYEQSGINLHDMFSSMTPVELLVALRAVHHRASCGSPQHCMSCLQLHPPHSICQIPSCTECSLRDCPFGSMAHYAQPGCEICAAHDNAPILPTTPEVSPFQLPASASSFGPPKEDHASD